MYIVSSAKKTVLSDFNTLAVKSTYIHSNDDGVDFQFFQKRPVFVEINKKSGIEILRIKEHPNGEIKMQKVRKSTTDGFCISCSKKSSSKFAVGTSNGLVKLYSLREKTLLHTFKSDTVRQCVLYTDFNSTDDHIASVLENGQIDIYGTKTMCKVDSIKIDGNSTLARFHPRKRSMLAVASYKGAVSVYDTLIKRKILNAVDSHAAPCRDLCMPKNMPDTMISVGYDCIINIFDTRRKAPTTRLNYAHPLSTVAVSDCGTYFCVGNLKGEISCYDTRTLKSCLVTEQIHDCSVTRLAFVPTEIEDSSFNFSGEEDIEAISQCCNEGAVNTETVKDTKLPIGSTRSQRDSFCDFLDFQSNKKLDTTTSRKSLRRDSFDWETLSLKPNEDSRLNAINTAGRMGTMGSFSTPISRDIQAAMDSIKSEQLLATAAPLRERSTTPNTPRPVKLMQIEEEEQLPINQIEENDNSGSDKENPIRDNPIVYDEYNDEFNNVPSYLQNSSQADYNAEDSSETNNASNKPQTEIDKLRAEMNARFKELLNEMNFTAETNKWHIYTQNFNLWKQQMNTTESILSTLNVLAQSDPFVNEFNRLKAENASLKQQLAALKK